MDKIIDSLSNLLNANRDLAFYIVFLIAIIVIIVAVLFGKKIIAWLSRKDYVNNHSPLTHSPQNFGGQQAVSSQGAMLAKEQNITNNHYHNVVNIDELKNHITSEFAKRDQTTLSEGERAEYEKKINNLEQALKDKQELDQSIIADLTSAKAALPALQIEEAMEKLNAGDRTEAVEILIKLAKAGKELAANAEFQLGKIAYDDIRWGEALVHFERAYGLESQNEEYIDRAALLNHLMGNYQKALPLLLKLVEMGETKHPNHDHEKLGERYNDLGAIYYQLKKYDEALPLYQKAIAIGEKVWPNHDHHYLAKWYNDLAVLYQTQNKYDEALTLYQKAIAIGEKLYPNHDNLCLATWYGNLAGLCQQFGIYDEAISLYQNVISIGEKAYPNQDHPDLAIWYNNIASCFNEICNFIEAEKFYKKAVAILIKTLPKTQLSRITSIENYANFLQKQGRNEEAQALLKANGL